MKQLFVDLLTKQKPNFANYRKLSYKFPHPLDEGFSIYVNIYPMYFSPKDSLKMELAEPFKNDRIGVTNSYDNYIVKKYCMSINDIEYVIDLTSEEILNVDLLFHKIFKEYQLRNLNYIKSLISSEKEQESTPEQKLDESQNQIIDGK